MPPPYTERVVSEQQIADIYAHVKAFPCRRTRQPSDIPEMQHSMVLCPA
jgi:hypothetical protein